MKYISTSSDAVSVSFEEAVDRCLAADGGTFMPECIPHIPRAFFNNISEMSLRDIAFVVTSAFLGEDIDIGSLKTIVDQSFSFDAPLRHLYDDIYVLELFHGPTLTFKDFGARFMSRLLRYFDKAKPVRRNVLVATTGNSGAAAANGFYNHDGIKVSVLYPKGHLSRLQTKQLTALGGNIYPVEVMGSIEDCKRIVRSAIADPTLAGYKLTGANSINIARIIPQICFVFHAYAQLLRAGERHASDAYYSMPTGNMSNLVAAAMALQCGVPAGGLIAATAPGNRLRQLLNGAAPAQPGNNATSNHSIAPAIEMVMPSGWHRMMWLFGNDLAAMRAGVKVADAACDAEIEATVNNLRSRTGYVIDTHCATALNAAEKYAPSSSPKVVFATGHPAKQLDIMTRITGCAIEMPVQLTRFMSTKRAPALLPPTMPAFKKYLQTINN